LTQALAKTKSFGGSSHTLQRHSAADSSFLLQGKKKLGMRVAPAFGAEN